MKSPGVYRIVCKATGRSYVGSSRRDWANRRNGHMYLLRSGRHPSKLMQEDWNQHGPESFSFMLICECDADKVLDLEKHACDEFKAFCPAMGYNTAKVSENRFRGGRKASGRASVRFSKMVKPEVARKLSELIEVGEDELLRLEHHPTTGWKYGNKIIGFKESPMAESLYARQALEQEPLKMIPPPDLEKEKLKRELTETKMFLDQSTSNEAKLSDEVEGLRQEVEAARCWSMDDRAAYWKGRALKAEAYAANLANG